MRVWLVRLALLSLVLSGCGAGAVRTTNPAPNSPPAHTPAAERPATQPVRIEPATAPVWAEPAGAPVRAHPAAVPVRAEPAAAPVRVEPAAPGEAPPAAPPPPAQSALWKPRGIGLPLATEDQAAREKRVVMLTFDDGPTPVGHTAAVLDALKAEQVKAVFFITGNGLKHRDLVERIHREGHVLGVHTVSHANLTRLGQAEIRKEIEPLITLIESVTGAKPRLFRPPYGAYNDMVKAVVAEYGLELVNWTNSSRDWEHREPAKVVDEVVSHLHRGAVVLLHDIKPHTAAAVPDLIKRIRTEGYEFVVMR